MELTHCRQILERTPRVLAMWLEGLDDAWTHARYGEGTFSAYHVVGHLIINEQQNWISRARWIVEHGVQRPFEAFAQRSTIEPADGGPLRALLAQFASLRAANLRELDLLASTPNFWTLRGVHPALGEVTMSQLMSTWTTHDIHHTAQIAKAMAYQCRDDVGPWRAYLNILPK